MIMLAAQISVLVVGFGGFAFSVFHFSDRPYPYGIGQIIYIGWMISSLLFCAGFLWSALTLKSEQKSDGNVTR